MLLEIAKGCVCMKRGDVFYADLRPVVGSEQGGIRPVLVVQNDVGNKYSPTVIAAAVTSRINKAKLPTHIELNAVRVRRRDLVEYDILVGSQNVLYNRLRGSIQPNVNIAAGSLLRVWIAQA